MAYVAVPTFVANDPLAADDLNIIGDDIDYLKAIADGLVFSGCDVTRVAATSIANTTSTAISFSAEVYDYGSWFSSGTNVVVPVGAIPSGTIIAVMVSGRTLFASNATGYRRLYLLKNGTPFASPKVGAINGDTTDMDVMRITTAVVGDVFTMEVYQNSGGALNVTNSQLTVVRYALVA